METTKKTGLDYSNQSIKGNLKNSIDEIKKITSERNLIIDGDLSLLETINLESATRSSKKKMAKKIHYFVKSKTRRKANVLMSFVFRIFLKGEKKIVISKSLEQQVIENSREELKGQIKLMLEKKEIYKNLKKQFKEKGGTYDN